MYKAQSQETTCYPLTRAETDILSAELSLGGLTGCFYLWVEDGLERAEAGNTVASWEMLWTQNRWWKEDRLQG